MMAEVGMAEAIQAVRGAKVGPAGKLVYRGAPLTSERLRAITEVAVLQAAAAPVTPLRVASCTQARI